jgi:hypothetical protein
MADQFSPVDDSPEAHAAAQRATWLKGYRDEYEGYVRAGLHDRASEVVEAARAAFGVDLTAGVADDTTAPEGPPARRRRTTTTG